MPIPLHPLSEKYNCIRYDQKFKIAKTKDPILEPKPRKIDPFTAEESKKYLLGHIEQIIEDCINHLDATELILQNFHRDTVVPKILEIKDELLRIQQDLENKKKQELDSNVRQPR